MKPWLYKTHSVDQTCCCLLSFGTKAIYHHAKSCLLSEFQSPRNTETERARVYYSVNLLNYTRLNCQFHPQGVMVSALNFKLLV